MLKFFAALFGFLNQMGQYFSRQQLIDAGVTKQEVKAQKEVEQNVQQAHEAVTIPDAPRTERLRSRFDRSYGNE